MKTKIIKCLVLSHIVGVSVFFNLANAEDRVYFSRANCSLPIYDTFQWGSTRNESITWDPFEFYSRAVTHASKWRFWGIKTLSDHWKANYVERTYDVKHRHLDIDEFGIHSTATHLDVVSQSLWGVLGKHSYKGPFNQGQRFSPTVTNRQYIRLPNTVATDCNLQVSQFFGNF
jgi:hypothetical protein